MVRDNGINMLSSRFRRRSDSLVLPLAGAIAKSGISPNTLTVLGLMFSTAAMGAFALKEIGYALVMLLLTSFFDIVDGAVARETARVSRRGGFLDSVFDRYSDFFIFIGVMLYLEKYYVLILIVMAGSLLVSYTRARAELLVPKCDVGIAERAERLLIIVAATFLEAFNVFPGADVFYVALILLAVLTHATVIHRIAYTYTNASD